MFTDFPNSSERKNEEDFITCTSGLQKDASPFLQFQIRAVDAEIRRLEITGPPWR